MTIGELKLDNTPHLDLGNWGTLQYIASRTLQLDKSGVSTKFHLPTESVGSNFIDYVFSSDNGYLLLTWWADHWIYRLDLKSGEFAQVSQLKRKFDDDIGLYSFKFLEVTDGVVALYESGLQSIDHTGKVRWQVDFGNQRLDWNFVELRDDVIWYQDADEETTWGYKVQDGYLVGVQPT